MSLAKQIEINIRVAENEAKILPIIWFGDKDANIKAKVRLDKKGSSIKILCIFFANKHHLKLETEVEHIAPDTYSRTIIKGALDCDALADCEGRVIIKNGAKNADADLKEYLLLLSKSAHARALPCLEVYENEVKAGHGATISNVASDELFYLATRGLSKKEAKSIIVRGFLEGFANEFEERERNEILNAIERFTQLGKQTGRVSSRKQ